MNLMSRYQPGLVASLAALATALAACAGPDAGTAPPQDERVSSPMVVDNTSADWPYLDASECRAAEAATAGARCAAAVVKDPTSGECGRWFYLLPPGQPLPRDLIIELECADVQRR
jgi:hypothetical protein